MAQLHSLQYSSIILPDFLNFPKNYPKFLSFHHHLLKILAFSAVFCRFLLDSQLICPEACPTACCLGRAAWPWRGRRRAHQRRSMGWKPWKGDEHRKPWLNWLNHLSLPSGKRLHNYGKSPFSMGKSTISMVIFNSYVKLPEGIYFIVSSLKYIWYFWYRLTMLISGCFTWKDVSMGTTPMIGKGGKQNKQRMSPADPVGQ